MSFTNAKSDAIKQRLTGAFIVGLSLIALVVRWKAATRSGLWGDESLFLFVANLPTFGQTLSFLHFHESHPPLFYLIMRVWQGIFGHSDTAVLVPPVLFSTAIVPTAFLVGRRVFGLQAGIIAALLTTFSAALIDFGVQVRPYALLQLVCLLSTYLLLRTARLQTRASWLAYVVSAVLLPYLHNWGWLVVVAQGIAYGLTLLPLGRGSKKPLLHGIAAYLSLLVLYLPWLPALISQSKFAGHAPLNLWVLAGKTVGKLGLHGTSLDAVILVGKVLLVIVALVLIGAAWISGVKTQTVVTREEAHGRPQTGNAVARLAYIIFAGGPVTAVLLALVLSSHSDLMKMRCLTIVFPSLLVAVSGIIGSILSRKGKGLALAGHIAAVLVMAGVLIISARGVKQLLATPKSTAREYAAAVGQQIRADDAIVIAPEWNAASFNWYFKGNNEQLAYPTEGRVEAMPYDNLLARYNSPENFRRVTQWIERAHAQSRRIWYILPADFQPSQTDMARDVAGETDWYASGLIRTQQLYHELTTLYGTPESVRLPGNQPGAEIAVVLFDTNHQ